MAKRKSVYIDTTVPSYYFEERGDFRVYREITRRWWNTERKHYDIYISGVSMAELEYGEYPHKNEIISLVKGIPLLEVTQEVEDIANIYI